MSEVHIGGSYTSALTHLAGLGVAAILEESGHRGVRILWTQTANPKMLVSGPGVEATTVAQLVIDHAERHARRNSWVQAVTKIRKGGKEAEVGLFSPRIAAPEGRDSWVSLYTQRRAVFDADQEFTWLDGQFVQALGEPAYWQADLKDPMPDEGASRWEMKTRNRGEDFVRNRLAPLAREVSGRSVDAVATALSGKAIHDSAGKEDSRTGSGFTTPRPVDDAVAWCSLWGISAFRLFPAISGVAVTPGAWPAAVTHPSMMALPLSTSPLSLAKIRRIIRSKPFSDASFGSNSTDSGSRIQASAARVSLKRTGVDGIVRFPIRKGGSISAPERQILAGIFDPF